MSTQKRRITYWSIDFIKQEEHLFDPAMLCRFMAYVAGLDETKRLEKNTKTNKAISLESVKDENVQGIQILKIVFKSSISKLLSFNKVFLFFMLSINFCFSLFFIIFFIIFASQFIP